MSKEGELYQKVHDLVAKIDQGIRDHIKTGKITPSTPIRKISIRFTMEMTHDQAPLVWQGLKELGYRIDSRTITPPSNLLEQEQKEQKVSL